MSDSKQQKEQPKEENSKNPVEETGDKKDVGMLEEDDEFEEFPAEEWDKEEEDPEDVNVWEDNWDDDFVEDDFGKQLRAELQKQGFTGAAADIPDIRPDLRQQQQQQA